MKKTKLLLALLATSLCLAGCNKQDGENGTGGSQTSGQQTNQSGTNVNPTTGGGSGQTPSEYMPDTVQHVIPGTIHDFDIDYDHGNPFIGLTGSDYKILVIDNSYALKAAKYIANQIQTATKIALPVETITSTETIIPSRKVIVVGNDEVYMSNGLTLTTRNIGSTGYEMHTVDNALFIRGTGNDSYQLAAIKFLELTIGFDVIYGEYIVYDKDGSILPKMDVVERPDYDYRKIDDQDTSWRYGAGFTDNIVFEQMPARTASQSPIQYHNSFNVLPPSMFYSSHRKWYNQTTSANIDGHNGQLGQLCYTAHGDATEYNAMVAEAADVVYNVFKKDTALDNLTFTIEDNKNECTCNACQQAKAHYNGSIAATVVNFLNDVDKIVEAKLLADGNHRSYYISLFAYHNYESAPCKKVGNSYLPVDNIHTRPHVGVFIAPISSYFTHSFYEDINTKFSDAVKGWEQVTDNMQLWIYETNYANYMMPYNCFDSMPETYRFLYEHSCYLIYVQGQHDSMNRTGFSRLKLYQSSKLLNNINLNAKDIVDKYFTAYYDKGAPFMRAFYEEMKQWCYYQEVIAAQNEINYGLVSSGQQYMSNPILWKANMLEKWADLCYQAIDAIDYLRLSEPYRYRIIKDAMLTETIFPRYCLLTMFESKYSDADLKAKRVSFKEDCDYLSFDRYGEGAGATKRDLASIYANWGIA